MPERLDILRVQGYGISDDTVYCFNLTEWTLESIAKVSSCGSVSPSELITRYRELDSHCRHVFAVIHAPYTDVEAPHRIVLWRFKC